MPLARKKRVDRQALQTESNSSDDTSSKSDQPASADTRRRDRTDGNEDEEDSDSARSAASHDSADDGGFRAPSSTDLMVKKLVRLALSCEYARLPIRRIDITAKVLGDAGPRSFKTVFDGAQKVLHSRFGMQMVDLPVKERVTISQRRAAQKVERPSSTSKSWILTSTLPLAYRTPAILPPTKAPSSFQESTYTAIYTFLISIITLSGGSIAEQKLDRYLRRMNADTYTPVDRTDRLLQRLCKDGYLIRNREMDGGEEVIEYMVGPRGKIEVGESGVEGMVREVYGQNFTTSSTSTPGTAANAAREAEQRDDFERRLERSLTSSRRDRPAPPAPPAPPAAANGERTEDGEKDGAQNGGRRAGQRAAGQCNTRRRSTRGRGNHGDSMDEDSD